MAEMEHRKAVFESMRLETTRRIPLDADSEKLIRQLIRLDEAVTWLGWIQWRIQRAGAMPRLTEFEKKPSENVEDAGGPAST